MDAGQRRMQASTRSAKISGIFRCEMLGRPSEASVDLGIVFSPGSSRLEPPRSGSPVQWQPRPGGGPVQVAAIDPAECRGTQNGSVITPSSRSEEKAPFPRNNIPRKQRPEKRRPERRRSAKRHLLETACSGKRDSRNSAEKTGLRNRNQRTGFENKVQKTRFDRTR
jgi:hypothetical protein